MAFTSEPWEDTLARRQSSVADYPELQYSTPTEIAQVDGAFPDRLPTTFSQQAVRLANFGSQPDDPNAPDAAPNALPWTTSGPLSGAPQPAPRPYGASYDEGAQPASGGVAGGAGDNGRSPEANIGSFLGGLVGWGNLDPSLQPDSGAPLSQQLRAGQTMAIEQALGSNLPAGSNTLAPLLDQGATSVLDRAVPPVARAAQSWMEAADSAIADVQAAQRAAAPEAFQIGRMPETDSLFTAGPNGEVVGPTGNVSELRLGREPQVGEDVNAGLRYTNYGRAQQDALAAEEQAAFRDAGARAISGAEPPAGDVPQTAGGASRGGQAPLTPGEMTPEEALALFQSGKELTDAERFEVTNALARGIGAVKPEDAAAAREAFYRDPANLGGGQTLSPAQQASLDALAPRAAQSNTITDSLANARAGEAVPTDALDSVIARNADTLPEPNRTQPPPGYLDRFRQPPAGGADLPSEVPITPANPFGLSGAEQASGAAPFPDAPGTPPAPPPDTSSLLRQVAHYADPRNVLDTWAAANNVKRTINTFFDFASPLRTSYLTVTHPAAWGTGWANTAKVLATKPLAEVEPAIQGIEDSILAHPTFQQIGVSSPADLYGPDSAFGMRALRENSYTGQLEPHQVGSVVNRIPVLNRSARLLNTFQRTAGPQILEDMISEDLANGRLPADFNVQDPAYRDLAATYGKAADQALGNGTLFQGDAQKQAANLFLNFGNWAAARLQMLGNGATGIAKNVANLAPGVNAELSPAERESARMLTRLGAAATSATYAINLANGIQPDDQRMYHNGIPVVVITPKMAAALNAVGQQANNMHIPGVAGLLNYKPNTGVSLYLGLGTMVGQGIGIARAGYEGATGGSRFGQAPPTTFTDRLKDAVGNPFDPQSYGMSNEAIYALRGYLAGVPALAADLGYGKTMGGETPSLRNEVPAPFMAENLVTERPQSSGSVVLNAVGGRAYEPSAAQAARNGDFSGLQPNDQLKAINTQSWTGLATHPEVPKELQAVIGHYPSHYAWQVSFRENTAKAYEQNGYTTANAYALADRALAQQPIQKAYENVKNAYEDRWIKQNPTLAEQVLEEDAGKDPSARRLSVTNAQRDFIQQAVGGKR